MKVEYENLLSSPSGKLYQEDTSTTQSHHKKTRTLTDNRIISEYKSNPLINESAKDKDMKSRHLTQSDNPPNQPFSPHFQIDLYKKNYFFFEYQGTLSKSEFKQKTKMLRNYPLHIKLTLFFQEKDKIIRQRELSLIEVTFNELREEGNKLYKKEKYYEALDLYIEAYGLLKWLQFKDKSFLSYAYITQNQHPILDDDIVECSNLFKSEADIDESSSNDKLCSILLCLSYCFMQLRLYHNAIECCDECLMYDENNTTALFRRSQARLYNKKSNRGDLEWGLGDIEKAITILREWNYTIPNIFNEHYEILKKEIVKKKEEELEQISEFIEEGYLLYNKSNKIRWETNEKDESYKIQELQYRVLNIMKKKYKMTILYYLDVSEENKFKNAYEEYEYFMERKVKFKNYHKLNVEKYIDIYKKERRDDRDYEYLNQRNFYNFLQNFKNKKADNIFQESIFNLAIIKEAIKKATQSEDVLHDQLNLIYSRGSVGEFINKEIRLPEEFSFYVSIMLLIFSLFFMLAQLFLFVQSPQINFEF